MVQDEIISLTLRQVTGPSISNTHALFFCFPGSECFTFTLVLPAGDADVFGFLAGSVSGDSNLFLAVGTFFTLALLVPLLVVVVVVPLLVPLTLGLSEGDVSAHRTFSNHMFHMHNI